MLLTACLAWQISGELWQMFEDRAAIAGATADRPLQTVPWLEDIGPTFITIAERDGQIELAVNSASVADKDELREVFDSLAHIDRRALVILQSDDSTSFEQAMAVLDLAREAGLQNVQLTSSASTK